MTKWSEADAPDQSGRVFIVTGANSGIGFEATKLLCEKRGHVVMACRDRSRAETALEGLKRELPGASAEIMLVDLADLSSVRAFADAFRAAHDRLDVLINNAGLMAIPRRTTADGFEMQFGVNHLGHFALTARLWAPLTAGPGRRVVTVSSEVHRNGKMRFDDLMGERKYSRWGAYMQSKLANILFTRRLQAEFTRRGADALALACHPGYASTELQGRSENAIEDFFFKRITNRLLAQSARMGALPTLRAAVDPTLAGGVYVGPKGFGGARGAPEVMAPGRGAQNDEDAERLWTVSQRLTGEVIGD